MPRFPKILALALVALALERAPLAQCVLDDQLDGGPCCSAAQPVLPPLASFATDALGICWRDCGVDQIQALQARWIVPKILAFPSACGEGEMRLVLTDVNNVVLWQGRMRLLYARSWLETDPLGHAVQVWRYLVNGDLRPTAAAGSIPCPVPPCAPVHGNRVRFTGYVDLGWNCVVIPGFYQAWMLTHACDSIDHEAGFPRGGTFHPDRTYTFVGPGTGFVPGALQPSEGTLSSPFESLRQRHLSFPIWSGPATCDIEEPSTHSLTPQQSLCRCGAPNMPAQYMLGDLAIQGACGSSLVTPAGGGALLPGFVSMGIGSWTLPGVFPGVEAVRWNTSEFAFIDGCFPLVVQQEVFYGVSTLGGFPATQLVGGLAGGPLPPVFVDQANARDRNTGALLMNAPFVSDKLHALNH